MKKALIIGCTIVCTAVCTMNFYFINGNKQASTSIGELFKVSTAQAEDCANWRMNRTYTVTKEGQTCESTGSGPAISGYIDKTTGEPITGTSGGWNTIPGTRSVNVTYVETIGSCQGVDNYYCMCDYYLGDKVIRRQFTYRSPNYWPCASNTKYVFEL